MKAMVWKVIEVDSVYAIDEKSCPTTGWGKDLLNTAKLTSIVPIEVALCRMRVLDLLPTMGYEVSFEEVFEAVRFSGELSEPQDAPAVVMSPPSGLEDLRFVTPPIWSSGDPCTFLIFEREGRPRLHAKGIKFPWRKDDLIVFRARKDAVFIM